MRRLVLGGLILGVVSCGSSSHEPSGAAGGGGSAGFGEAGQIGAAGTTATAGSTGAGEVDVVQQALSGTRLKAYWYSATDGSKQFAQRWYDTTLKTDCSFQQGPDGTFRCLPQASFGTVLYGDSSCATPAAVALLKNSCMPTPSQWITISVADAAACNKFSTQYFNLGPVYSGPTFISSPGSAQPCAPNSGGSQIYPTATYDIYGLGTAVDLSLFQGGTLGHD